MWISTKERGIFNLANVSRITFDKYGTYFAIGSTTIVVCDYDASEKIAQALKNNQNFLEV